MIGSEAELLVHMFCIIDRQKVVVETLLKQGFIPREGLSVPHLQDASKLVYLSPETLRMLVVFTMADVADQYFGWQDQLFGGGGKRGSMIIPGEDDATLHNPTAIWPGVSRPGLWMSYLSQLGKLVRTYNPEWRVDDGKPALDIPPVFDNCTKVLSVDDEAEAIELYWSAVTATDEDDYHKSVNVLQKCITKNPFAFEPQVLLAQKLLHVGDFNEAAQTAKSALELQIQWGTAWDKRISFGSWVAWTRVVLQRAENRESWPTSSWEVNQLGLVR
eukprot:CAMPEP_0198144460 /NCGR_PEP_ID=MMETSP1443-20131203/16032_1 /TAXON_ID=186043 /ORGANISM="Entomoneis sp., Strain CCMP2396" /LENGTH=273 /DNA_ID=CAMNT_0043807861 /DNA_START=596 /DNA_END=1417 /DNA_ORIENTATION=-